MYQPYRETNLNNFSKKNISLVFLSGQHIGDKRYDPWPLTAVNLVQMLHKAGTICPRQIAGHLGHTVVIPVTYLNFNLQMNTVILQMYMMQLYEDTWYNT